MGIKNSGSSDICTEITEKIEVSVNGVLIHVFGDLFIEKDTAEFLHAIVAQFSFAGTEKDNYSALDKPVKINYQIVRLPSQIIDEGSNFSYGLCDAALFQVIYPLFPVRDYDSVQIWMARNEVGRGIFNDPGDICLRVESSKGGQRGKGMDNVADSAQFYNQNIHTKFFMRSLHIVIKWSKAFSAFLFPVLYDPLNGIENIFCDVARLTDFGRIGR